MIKKKCKECGTLLRPYAPEYCDVCHGNYGWWFTCDKHQEVFFRDEVEDCPICESEKVIVKRTSSTGNEASEYITNVNQVGIREVPPIIKEEAEKENIPNGFGGWLILLSIIIVIIPIRNLFILLPVYAPLIFDGFLIGVFERGSEIYDPPLGLLITFEIFGNIGLLVLNVIVLKKFFGKNYLFKKYFIINSIAALCFILLDLIFAQAIPITAGLEYEDIQPLFRQFIFCCIWVPYVSVSKRVKNTFVRGLA